MTASVALYCYKNRIVSNVSDTEDWPENPPTTLAPSHDGAAAHF